MNQDSNSAFESDYNVSHQNSNTFAELRKDKLLLFLFLAIIVLGTLVRVLYPTEPGLWNDDMSILPTAVLWFYPHTSYPGLSAQGEPAFSNLIIGASCMLSGQDFSNVSKIKPSWYPDRPILLGKAISSAEDYCRIPMYIFGFLFFAAIIIFSFMLLDKYSALYSIAFFAFHPYILQLSRYTRADIITFTFLVLGLLFLWKTFSSAKESRREFILFLLSMVFFALAFATKLPPVVYAFFAIIVLLAKYKESMYACLKKAGEWVNIDAAKKLDEAGANPKRLAFLLASGIITYILVLLPPFEFNLKNILLIKQMYTQSVGAFTDFGISLNILPVFREFVQNINPIDFVLLLFAVYIFIRLLLKKKNSREIYILLMSLILIVMAIIYPTTYFHRIFLGFGFGLILLMALAFSDKHYSMFNLLRIRGHSLKRVIFAIIIIGYIALSSYTAFSTMPYFEQNVKPLCLFKDCPPISYSSLAESHVGIYLQNLLENNTEETFDLLDAGMHTVYYYVAADQAYLSWQFRESFKQQIGRNPTARERVEFYRPNNKTLRYIVVLTDFDYNDEFVDELKTSYLPSDKVIIKHGIEVAWIYDLKNLQKII